jgi:hypothetical protein
MFDHRLVTDAAARLSAAPPRDLLERLAVHRSPAGPVLPVSAALATVLPDGLRRGSTIAVSGSVSLLLAALGAASADGAWCAMVGMPPISAEAARDFGIELSRLPLVPGPGPSWVVVVGALLDAVDVVVARAPAQLADGDIRRLAARARSRGAVFVPYLSGGSRWPHADVRLSVETGSWSGIGRGYGRLRQRQITVTATGRGPASRGRTTRLWLPAASGGVEAFATQPLATVVAIDSPTTETAIEPALATVR